MKKYDVIIIGAGLMGCFAARHLARRGYRVALLEQENDVSMGISRANTAIVYAGYDMKPGTLKAELTVKGNASFEQLCDGLGVKFERPGSLMLATGERAQKVLKDKLEQGLQNGVPGLRLIDSAEAQVLEPKISSAVCAALYAPTTGTVNPWHLCLAAARDALSYDAELFLEHKAVTIESGFVVSCSNGNTFAAPVVINCAGVNADQVSELVAPVSFRLVLSSGSYLMLDEAKSNHPRHIVFFEPEEKGKGSTFVPTTGGAVMLGPSEDILDQSEVCLEPGYPSKSRGLDFVATQSLKVFPDLPLDQTIRSFGTLRPSIHWAEAHAKGEVDVSSKSIHDLHIAWAKNCPGLLNVAGIKTPGLTCADGIGSHVANMVEEYLGMSGIENGTEGDGARVPVGSNADWDTSPVPLCPSPAPLTHHSDNEILCRCRQLTYGEARAAIRSKLGARTVDGLKRRIGSGLGRCQGSFCMERVMLLLAEELGCHPADILKDRTGSWIVSWCAKGVRGTRGDKGTGRLSPYQEGDKRPVPLSPRVPLTPLAHQLTDPRLLIIGGGAAGLSAAIAAHDAGVHASDILLVDRLNALGGILPQCSHHGFGNREHGGTLSGPEFLAPLLRECNERAFPVLLNTTVTSITPTRLISLRGPSGVCVIEPQALIFAGGCRERPFGALPIAGTRPSGIFTAGAAQRMLNLQGWSVGERIVILGSGDVGMVMAHTLTQKGMQVLALIEQATEVTGLKHNRSCYVDAHNIALLSQSTISQVFGSRRLEGVEIRDLTTNSTQQLACDTLIVSVGLIPETELLQQVWLGQPSRSWLFCAGNARRVHSYIEGVVADGKAAGAQAAALLL